MVAYEVYCRDKAGKEQFIGILPERRKNRRRITVKSVLNWGWKVIGDNMNAEDIHFIQVDA